MVSVIALSGLGGLGRFHHRGNAGVAAALAVVSTVCYAVSAVVQQQEASRPGLEVKRLLAQLARRPRWWLAVLASASGAGLHIAALAEGPLGVVQPIGVLTLVLALPLGARWGSRVVSGAQWCAAGAVAVGVAAVLAAIPHAGGPVRSPLLGLPAGTGGVGVVVVMLVVVATVLPGSAAALVRAGAAATCFGFASAMTRVAAVGAAPVLWAGAMAVAGAGAGLGLAQLAYRGGGLGSTLAILILVDPLIAVTIGVVVLGEPVPVTPARMALGVGGLAATALGIWALSRAGSAEVEMARRGR